jgi:anti-sigma regulatory factor (Ser/Thr protein kinase)
MLRSAVLDAAKCGDAASVAAAAEYAVPGDIDDDMAILAFTTSSADLPSVDRVFPAEPIMVSEARRLAAETFAYWGMDPGQSELACLLVSEVVTNAVLHAAITPHPSRRYTFDLDSIPPPPVPVSSSAPGPLTAPAPLPPPVPFPAPEPPGPQRATEFVLRLRKGASTVWVEVFDPDLRLPRLRTAGATDEGGRGLYLVEQLATRWGSRPTPEGKAVWFEMPISAD